EACFFALLETLQLFFGGDGEPELDNDGAVAMQLVLEIVDLGIGAHPVGFGTIALDALDQHPAIPGAIENDNAAESRQVAPEAPQIGVSALFLVGRGDGDDV